MAAERTLRVQLDAKEESTTEDPLTIQWAEFLDSVVTRRPPVNSGQVGVAALELIDRVREVIDANREEVRRGDDPDLRG
jgi:predicted dehydrogenase